MQQFQEPRILTNSHADYQLLKTRGRAGLRSHLAVSFHEHTIVCWLTPTNSI